MRTVTYLLAALLGMLLTSLTSQAQFNPIPGHVYEIRNSSSGNALEVGGSSRNSDGHIVNLWPYWGGAHQQWSFERVGTTGSNYKIINRNSRQSLRVKDASVNAILDGLVPVGQSWTNNENVWTIVELPGGRLTISRRYVMPGASTSSAFLLRTEAPYYPYGTSIPSYTGYNSVVAGPYADDYLNKTQWIVVDRSAATPGVFRIMNVNSGKTLTANPDNNNVTQYPMWYLANQEWTFSEYNADGYLHIINRNTNQVLEIGGNDGTTQPGRRANVWDQTGGWNQQWRLVDVNTPRQLTLHEVFTTGIPCKIVNRRSGYVLEIGGNGNELFQDDRPANQWYDWGGLNQRWNIYWDSNYRGTAPVSANTSKGEGESAIAAASVPALGALTLYPNPAKTTLQLTLPGNSEARQVTVTDARGRTVQVAHQQGKVDVSSLAPGLYIVSAADGRQTFRQKFVKE